MRARGAKVRRSATGREPPSEFGQGELRAGDPGDSLNFSHDAANCFLYQPQFPTVARKEVKGLWKDMPIFCNDLAAISWA